ncbi:MAG: efflux RND transporter periplasmic adaptor subunit [Gammaproteobacteria bacterium]
MKKRKWWIAGAIVVVIVIIVVVAVTRSGGNSVAVAAAKVAPRTIKSSVLASGQFAYKENVELRSQISGQIVSIPVKEGDRVTQGEVVLRIDPKTYQATVNQQQAQVSLQQDQINAAQLKLANLKKQWERNTKLFKKGLIDANDYDNVTNQYQLAEVDLESAEKSLTLAQALLSFDQEQLAKTVIRSPLDGIVTSLNVKVGESVIPGTTNIPGSTLMTIGDPSELLAVVNVDEADIAHIGTGESAQVTSTAYPDKTLGGTVNFVAPSATTMPGQQGQGFQVKIRVKQSAKLDMRPGMTCRAEIFTRSAKNALSVPVGAILFSTGGASKSLFNASGAYVFVIEAGKAKRVPVTLGISSDLWQVVASGLKKGEQVITGPYEVLHGLQSGTAVHARGDGVAAPVPHSG